VPSPRLVQLAGLRERFERELADRLEQRIALTVEADKALVDERLERVEARAGDRLGSVERPAAGEHADSAEAGLFLGLEQVVAPRDRAAQGSLPLGRVPPAARQQGQAAIEALEDLLRRERPHARCGQLEGEREMIHAPADGEHVLVGLEIPARCPRTADEESDRLLLDEGRDRIFALGSEP